MTMDFAEPLQVDGTVYSADIFPLNFYLASLPSRPRYRGWPSCSNGYYATWEVQGNADDRVLCLTELRAQVEDPLGLLFPEADVPVAATWFSGVIRGSRGSRRYTSYPPQTFFNDEIYLEIVSGAVVREWVLDLRSVPDQTDGELRLSLPACIWPSRLCDGAPD